MEAENSRRKFLKNLSAVAAGSVVASGNAMSMDTPKEDVIKTIKPLGFQWETQDPFIFCVHHEDFFPEGNERMGKSVDRKSTRLNSSHP